MAVSHYWYRNSQAHIFKVVGSGRVNNSRLCPGAKRSGERVHNALHCGMLAVLDFDPVQRTAGRGASNHALQPHQTSVAEQVRANLALLEVAREDTVHTPGSSRERLALRIDIGRPRRSAPSLTRMSKA